VSFVAAAAGVATAPGSLDAPPPAEELDCEHAVTVARSVAATSSLFMGGRFEENPGKPRKVIPSMTFEEFWPRYLRAHSDPRTRAFHVAGTIAATTCVLGAIAFRNPWLVPVGLVAGYGSAWFSHAFIEHNKPETLRAPFASLRGDYLMAWHVLRGTINEEMARATERTA